MDRTGFWRGQVSPAVAGRPVFKIVNSTVLLTISQGLTGDDMPVPKIRRNAVLRVSLFQFNSEATPGYIGH
jgi:hypothetical protein